MRFLRSTICLAAMLALCGTAFDPARGDEGAPAHADMTDDGLVLVTPTGMTLYLYGPEVTTPGKIQCTSVPKTMWTDNQGGFGPLPVVRPDAHKSCVQKWPPYLAPAGAQPIGEFGLIDRPEGKQWTWHGRPLYLSVKDHKPGDRFGATFEGDVRGRGWSFAAPRIELPGDLHLIRLRESLALATDNRRPVFTPKNKHLGRPCQDCDDAFKPIAAPAVATVTGDWSIIDRRDGVRQYAYKGQPLFAAPEGLTNYDIAESGAWEPVVFRKGSGHPSDIDTRTALIGEIYTDRAGRTLYAFTCNSPTGDGVSCSDPGDPAGYWAALCGVAEECAKRWHLYLADAKARPMGEWSIVEVASPLYTDPRGFTYPQDSPRVKAWAYRGQPVYTFYGDKKPGDVWGHWVQWLGFSRFVALIVPGTIE